MEKYKNLSGNSGVAAYEIDTDSITVEFHDGAVYLYNYQTNGQDNIEQMKKLAVAGKGLNSFITQNIGKAYAVKLR